MCKESAAGSGKCELGHQADPVAAHHPRGDLESAHAGSLPGCFADAEGEGKTVIGVCPVLGIASLSCGFRCGVLQGNYLVGLGCMAKTNGFGIKIGRQGIISHLCLV